MEEEDKKVNLRKGDCTCVNCVDDIVARREDRHIKHWVIRWMVSFVTAITSLIVLSVLYTYLFLERDLEVDVTNSVVNNIFTVLKFMFE